MRVLYIDDNQDALETFQELVDASEHECVVVNDGRKGIKLLKETNFDVIFLDLRMPNFSGFDFLRELKESNVSEQNIVIVSGLSALESEKSNLASLGVSRIIKKPYDYDLILKTINYFEQKNKISNSISTRSFNGNSTHTNNGSKSTFDELEETIEIKGTVWDEHAKTLLEDIKNLNRCYLFTSK